MKFNNIDFESLGLVVMNIQGILDMPKREGTTYYDWGNGYEPLLSESDIYFGSRDIVVDAFFDSSRGDFKTTMGILESITGDNELVTNYGTNTVRLDGVQTVKRYNSGKILKIHFKELNPDLSMQMPSLLFTASGTWDYSTLWGIPTKSAGGLTIDGADLFGHFGFLVESVTLYDINRLKSSSRTAFQSNTISVFRQPQQLEIKVNGIYASASEMSLKISRLNSLLAKEGYRHLVYNGEGFQCFCDQGYKVNIKGNVASADISLKKKALS